MGQSELDGSMLTYPVHSCINIHIIEHQNWNIIVGVIVYRSTCILDIILDVVTTPYFQCPVIKMAAVVITEYHLRGVRGEEK